MESQVADGSPCQISETQAGCCWFSSRICCDQRGWWMVMGVYQFKLCLKRLANMKPPSPTSENHEWVVIYVMSFVRASLSPCVWILPCLFITYWKLCGPVEGRHHPQSRGRRGRQEHPGKPGRRRESTRKTRKTDRLMSTMIFLHVKVEVTDQNIPWIGMLGVRCSLFMSRNSGHGSRNLWDLFSSSNV